MRSKFMKIAAIGLFAVVMLLNVSVYFDSNNQDADISLRNLKVNLFQRAYASEANTTVWVNYVKCEYYESGTVKSKDCFGTGTLRCAC